MYFNFFGKYAFLIILSKMHKCHVTLYVECGNGKIMPSERSIPIYLYFLKCKKVGVGENMWLTTSHTQLPSSLSASIALSLRPPTFDPRQPAFCQGFLAIHFHLLLLLRISKKWELTFMVALRVNDTC